MTDTQIVAEFTNGAHAIARNCSQRLLSRIPVEDLEQAALMAAIRAVRTYSPDHGTALSSWVIGKMRYAVIDAARSELHLRSRGRDVIVASLDNTDTSLHAATVAVAPDRWSAIEAAIDLEILMRPLKPLVREIFWHRMRGQTMSYIARLLGFSECRGNQLVTEAMKLMRGAALAGAAT